MEEVTNNKVIKRIGLCSIGFYACVELHIGRKRYWRFVDINGSLIQSVRGYHTGLQAEQLLTVSPNTFELTPGETELINYDIYKSDQKQ